MMTRSLAKATHNHMAISTDLNCIIPVITVCILKARNQLQVVTSSIVGIDFFSGNLLLLHPITPVPGNSLME